jgi:hypothetical protein
MAGFGLDFDRRMPRFWRSFAEVSAVFLDATNADTALPFQPSERAMPMPCP